MPAPITLKVETAQQIKDLLPQIPMLGADLNAFFKILGQRLDDSITEAQRKGTDLQLTVKP